MDDVERLLPSPALAVLVGVIVVLCLLVAGMREAWLGGEATVDPVVAGLRTGRRARTRAAALRGARVVTAVLLALALAVLVVVTVVRFAVLAEQDGNASAAGTATVSGVAPPEGDLPGWGLVFTDDFARTTLGPDFSAYSGKPGGDPYSVWNPDHVAVRDGLLILEGYRRDGVWTTGGVSNWPVSQTYGRWEVRFRAQPSDEVTYHFLLWPQSDGWPPEIDFAEDFGGRRDGLAAFLHYTADGAAQKVQRDLSGVDFTQWHTVGVEWSPGQVRFLLDGEVWSTVDSPEVPDEPMWLALQAQSGGCERKRDFGFPACPIVGVPDRAAIAIDWVAVYARR